MVQADGVIYGAQNTKTLKKNLESFLVACKEVGPGT